MAFPHRGGSLPPRKFSRWGVSPPRPKSSPPRWGGGLSKTKHMNSQKSPPRWGGVLRIFQITPPQQFSASPPRRGGVAERPKLVYIDCVKMYPNFSRAFGAGDNTNKMIFRPPIVAVRTRFSRVPVYLLQANCRLEKRIQRPS